MKARNVAIVLFVLVLLFIWGNSMLSPELSGRLSDAVADLISSIFGGEGGDELQESFNIRKLAHYLEFCALGFLSALILSYLSLENKERAAALMLSAIFFPLVDETIQLFSGRGPAIKDMWIDIAGFASGAALLLLIALIKKKTAEKKKK